MSNESNGLPAAECPELTLMRTKLPSLRWKLNQPFPLCYQLIPTDHIRNTSEKEEFIDKIRNPQTQAKDLTGFTELILGCVEGCSGATNPLSHLIALYSEQKLQSEKQLKIWQQIHSLIVESKVSQKFYGAAKDKSYSVWQVKDLETLQDHYDVEGVKQHRKVLKQFGSYYRLLSKFVKRIDALVGDVTKASAKQLYEEYKRMETEEGKYEKLVSKGKKLIGTVISATHSPLTIPRPHDDEKRGQQKNDTAQQPSDANSLIKHEVKQQVQQSKSTPSGSLKPIPQGTPSSPIARPSPPQSKGSLKKPLKASADKKNKQQQQKSLEAFFQKKTEGQCKANEPSPSNSQMQPEQQSTDLLDQLLTDHSLQQLQAQFQNLKIAPKVQSMGEKVYVNIVLVRSRLEYYDYMVSECLIEFTDPLEERECLRYEDSSFLYSELIADSIDEGAIEEDDEDEAQQQSNSAIVPNSYCSYKSSYIFSSESESSGSEEPKPKPELHKGEKWSFSWRQSQQTYTVTGRRTPQLYTLVILDDEELPLATSEVNEQSTDDVSPETKIEMYKQIHGSYIAKDALIRKINALVENKISMNKLGTLIKDITEKRNNQRVIKPEIVRELAEELTESAPQFQQQMEQVREQRQAEKGQEISNKREEKQLKLEKAILEYNGHLSAKDLLAHLRSLDFKILKSELSGLLKQKQGEDWQRIHSAIRQNKRARNSHKPKSASKNSKGNSQLMNTHKDITEIFKQNQIDMMSRPARPSSPPQPQVRAIESEESMQRIEQQDQSYDNAPRRKPLRRGKKRIHKPPVIEKHSITPVRRNPRRNKSNRNTAATPQSNGQQSVEEDPIQHRQGNLDSQSLQKELSQVNQQMQQEHPQQYTTSEYFVTPHDQERRHGQNGQNPLNGQKQENSPQLHKQAISENPPNPQFSDKISNDRLQTANKISIGSSSEQKSIERNP